MTMWYRSAQDKQLDEAIKKTTVRESPFTSLKSKEATPEEIELAKKLISAKATLQQSELSKLSDDEIAKIIESHKEIYVILKKVGSLIDDAAKSIPFENLKPTLRQFASSINDLSEQNVSISLAPLAAQGESRKKLDEQIGFLNKVPTDLNGAIKVVKNMDAKDFYYYTNLFGDLIINAKPMTSFADFPATALLIPIKIMDYKLTWIPQLETDIAELKKNISTYQTTKNKSDKEKASKEIYARISRILGFGANLCFDIGFTIKPAAILHTAIAGISLALISLGAVLQSASFLTQPDSPLNYAEIGKLPGKLADSIARVYEGVPLIDSPKDADIKKLEDVPVQIQYLINGLAKEYDNYDPRSWANTYGTKKSKFLTSQPAFTIMKFAKDKYSEKYLWLDQPENVNYRNLARAIKAYTTFGREQKLTKPTPPSKRSIGYQLVDSALNNEMTYKRTKDLIREMANKYTAGNIYNFLNKKNVEIIDLLGREMQNQNFAARYNVRPGNAGYDAVRIDIGNLKKILNTWK